MRWVDLVMVTLLVGVQMYVHRELKPWPRDRAWFIAALVLVITAAFFFP